jgi:hypothetical protein
LLLFEQVCYFLVDGDKVIEKLVVDLFELFFLAENFIDCYAVSTPLLIFQLAVLVNDFDKLEESWAILVLVVVQEEGVETGIAGFKVFEKHLSLAVFNDREELNLVLDNFLEVFLVHYDLLIQVVHIPNLLQAALVEDKSQVFLNFDVAPVRKCLVLVDPSCNLLGDSVYFLDPLNAFVLVDLGSF